MRESLSVDDTHESAAVIQLGVGHVQVHGVVVVE